MNKCQKIFRRCLLLFGYGKERDTINDTVNDKQNKPKKRRCAYCLIVMDVNKLDKTKFVSIDKSVENNETINLDFCKIGCLLEYSGRPYL